MCFCPAGDTGAVCKHQLAASQFSAVKLPQMFGCPPFDKYVLSKIVYGDKSSYDLRFFIKLGGEHSQEGVIEQAGVIEQESVIEQASGIEQEGDVELVLEG